MSGTQLLRLLVNERLAAAAEEIFGLVEKSIAEYQDEAVRSKREIIQLKQQIEQLTVLKPEVVLFREDPQLVSEELPPSVQECGIKVEEIFIEDLQVKVEQVDQCIGTDVGAETYDAAEVKYQKSELDANWELLPSYTAETLGVNESIDNQWNERDGSSSPHQIDSGEVFVELEQPPSEEKSCHFCDKTFERDTHLMRHVAENHKGHKAFKCPECNKEFEHRYHLVQHTRVHTGEKPYSCDFCGKAFTQNSSRLAHMRVHTGQKPYFCVKCGKSFATSNHIKICKVQNDFKITPENGNKDKQKEKAFKCFECNKEFNGKRQLLLHARVHSGGKPFSCDFCGKSFTKNSSRVVHMKVHAREKPYFCKKCGKRFATSSHHRLCKGTQNKNTIKPFHCTECGRSFRTYAYLRVHMEAQESWRRHSKP